MNQTMRFRPTLVVALLLLALAGGLLWEAQSFDRASAIFPIFIGKIFVGLVLLEIVFEVQKMIKPVQRNRGEEERAPANDVWKEFKGVLWLSLFLLLLYLSGFVVSIPLYIFAFLRFSARRSLSESLLMASGVSLFVYIMFMMLLGYDLHGGVLFTS